jgi:hypothetical protein
MNRHPMFIGLATVALAALAATEALSQAAPPAAPAAAPAPYPMTFGDLMNTLVQPRHAKLGLAGQSHNWPLAQYALVELRQTFAGIAQVQPKFRGLPVAELIDAAVKEPMNAVEAAIREQDATKFSAAYAQLTAGCNACHSAAYHPFVVIKAPDVSAFPDQDFNAKP